MKDKISIIVAIYNVEAYIKQCLDSLINQSYKNIEIICIDDGSPDNSKTIIEKYISKDNRIKLIQQVNQGLSSVRNNGIYNASGKYIYFIDGDDFIPSNYLENHINAIKKSDFKVSHSPSYINYYGENDPKNNEINIHNNDAFKTNNITHSTWSKVFDLEFLKLTKIEFTPGRLYEDYEFWNKYIANINKIAFVKNTPYYYRQRPNSIIDNSKSTKKYNNQIILCIQSIHTYFTNNKTELTFKPLYISLLNDHLYYHQKKHRLRFILETRKLLRSLDPDFKSLIQPSCKSTYVRFTSCNVISLIIKSYLKK